MNPLQDIPLRDIHAAPAVPWWPPAPGWWVLAVVVLALLVYLFIIAVRLWRRRQLRRTILRELRSLGSTYQANQDQVALARGLSSFARRLALFTDGQSVSGLHGQSWLSYLDETGDTQAFTLGEGKALLAAPYQPMPEYDANALVAVMRSWAERMLRKVTS